MEKEIGVQNTKAEILKAYSELLKKIGEQKSDQPKLIQEETKKNEMIGRVSKITTEGIISSIASLKLGVAKELDKLSEQLLAENNKLEEIQTAISLEKKNLEDLYGISANADSLAAILLAQKEKKTQFETDMAQRQLLLDEKMKSDKAAFDEKMAAEKLQFETAMKTLKDQWKAEQEKWNDHLKETKEATEKQRKREEEDYLYNLKLARKKETDIYEEKKTKLEKELAEKKAAFEKEISDREAKVLVAETELADLRIKAQNFPKELEKAIATAEKNVADKITRQFDFEKQLVAKENLGELKLRDQTIVTLQSKIKDMENTIKELSGKATTAEASVKDIAIKAIESARKLQIIEKSKDNQDRE